MNSPVTECLTDGQIQHELEKVVTAHHLKRDLTHEYFLMSPPHVEKCFTNDPSSNRLTADVRRALSRRTSRLYCAYHQNTSLSPMLLYCNDPYVTGIPGCDDGNHPNGPSDGALVGGLSHEHNESITDPMPNDAWTNGAGANQGFEIGDQCDGQMGTPLGTAPNGAKYNQVINGHFYWYQEEWSNQGHTCLQRFTLSGNEADGEVHGHRRQRAGDDVRCHGLDRTGRRRRLRLAVQRRFRRPDRRADDSHDHPHLPGGWCVLRSA